VRKRGSRTVVGFAAETEALLENARAKLARKGCDLIVANDVSRADIGFDVDRNEVVIVGPRAEDVRELARAPKSEIAARILERVLEVRRG
jgi:phosphopantothenoylcysteine decarboxylase/phosphopantothenate--cysteine ligase